MSKFQFRYICALLFFIFAGTLNDPVAHTLAALAAVVYAIGAVWAAWKERKEAHQ